MNRSVMKNPCKCSCYIYYVLYITSLPIVFMQKVAGVFLSTM